VAEAEWYDRRHIGEQRLRGRRTVGAYLARLHCQIVSQLFSGGITLGLEGGPGGR
jgi:hypothetical protein